MAYNYREAVKNDVLEAIKENGTLDNMTAEEIEENKDDLFESLHDALWVDDSVSGNASGSYTFNCATAEEYVKDNLSLCIEACMEFGVDEKEFGKKVYNEEWEYLDVSIRCYLLGETIFEVLDNIIDDIEILSK